MLSAIWDFLNDPNNRTVLGWLGGGLVVVFGGVWAVVKFLLKKKTPSVSATQGGVAAGGDIRNSKISTRSGSDR
jgi:hypothetical protein